MGSDRKKDIEGFLKSIIADAVSTMGNGSNDPIRRSPGTSP